MAVLKGIKGIIFDLDGTLVESSLNFSIIRQEIGCPQNIDLLDHIESLPQAQKDVANEIVERHEQLDAQSTRLIDGFDTFYKRALMLNKQMAVITRNSPAATNIKLNQTNLAFDMVLTRNDSKPKPHPESILIVLKRWQLEPQEVIYIGDYRYDIEAANRANVTSVLYAPNETPTYANQADFVFSDWEHFTHRLG